MNNFLEIAEAEKKKFDEWCETREIDNFDRVVHISHSDGSTFLLYHAAIWQSEEMDDNGTPLFFGVSTEHNGDYFFHIGDLNLYHSYPMYI